MSDRIADHDPRSWKLPDKRLAEILAPELRRALLRLDTLEGVKDKIKQALGALRRFASVFKAEVGDVGLDIEAPSRMADSGNLHLGPYSRRSGDIAAVLKRPVERVAPVRACIC